MRHGFFVHASQERGAAKMTCLTNQAGRRGSTVVHRSTTKGGRIFVAI